MASSMTSDSGTCTWRYDICGYTSSHRCNFERHEKSYAHKHLLKASKECESMETQGLENEEEVDCTDLYQIENEHSVDQNSEYLKSTWIDQINKTSSKKNNEFKASYQQTTHGIHFLRN